MATIRLRNDFHGSEVGIRVPRGLPHTLTPSQVRRVRKELCGNKDCTCGAIRGVQWLHGRRLDVWNTGDAEGNPTWEIAYRGGA